MSTLCGTVAIIGRPNAGKSTLLNTLLGQKISIVSAKVQTTRMRITGILSKGNAQLILLDTPGLMQPRTRFERAMVASAREALSGVDAVIHLVDASTKNPLQAEAEIISQLPQNTPVILVLNKIDQIAKPKLLEQSVALNAAYSYAATFMISGLKGDGVKDLQIALLARMPQGPWLYAEDQVTDLPERLLAAEITREKIFEQLYQELPHATLVETESWERDERGLLHIGQAILIQRESQKAIVLGKGGSRIKAIGQASRLELEEILEEKIHLKLFVKIAQDWPERAEFYQALGLNFRA